MCGITGFLDISTRRMKCAELVPTMTYRAEANWEDGSVEISTGTMRAYLFILSRTN